MVLHLVFRITMSNDENCAWQFLSYPIDQYKSTKKEYYDIMTQEPHMTVYFLI